MKWGILTLLSVIFIILLVGTVSAFDIRNVDDVKSYDKETKIYSLKNFFGLGKSIADLELKTPQHNKVEVGYGKVAEVEIRNKEYDYQDIINGMELYDIKKDMKEIIRDVDYKYKTYEKITIEDYKEVCQELTNGTKYNCYNENIGSHIEDKEVWKDFTNNSLKKNQVLTLGLFTDVKEGDHIEWVINIYGDERLVEWAEWEADFITSAHGLTLTSGSVNFQQRGWLITIEDLGGLKLGLRNITKHASAAATIGYVFHANATVIASASFVGNVATFSSVIELEELKTYIIAGDKGGAGYQQYIKSEATPNILDENITWFMGYQGSGNNDSAVVYNILSATYSLEVAPQPPTLTLNSPINFFNTTNPTIEFNGTAFDDVSVDNITLYIDDVFNETNSTPINNTPTIFTKILTESQHNWTYEVCNNLNNCVNDTRNLTISNFIENSYTFNPATTETVYETFVVNITANGTTPTSAFLIYNGTEYTEATITSLGGKDYNLSRTITIPNSPGTKEFNFSFSLGTTEFNTSVQTQEVFPMVFTICNATYTIPYLNFTFKDETDDTVLNVTNDLSDANYWVDNSTNAKSYLFTNVTDNYDYTFCFSPPNKTVTIGLTFKYSKTGYPLRTFAYVEKELTNITTNQTLYLLATADGIYSSIAVIETSGGAIQGVGIQIERQFAGVWTIISQDTTGSDGVATFWVNPNFQHRITATKTGYVTTQVTITPSQTLYTLTLQKTTGNATFVSDLPGIKWIALPQSGSIDVGTRSFNVTVTSSESNLKNCKFELINATNLSHALASITSFTNSSYCFLEISHNAEVNNNFFGRLSLDTLTTTGFVIVNSDWKWIVIDIDAKSWRSITSFFSDLKTLSEFGEGNEGDFSRIITFFLLTTILFGVFIYFTGIELTSPGVTVILIWGITLFASAGGFLTFNSGSDNINSVIEQWGFLFIFTIYMVNYFLTVLRRANE